MIIIIVIPSLALGVAIQSPLLRKSWHAGSSRVVHLRRFHVNPYWTVDVRKKLNIRICTPLSKCPKASKIIKASETCQSHKKSIKTAQSNKLRVRHSLELLHQNQGGCGILTADVSLRGLPSNPFGNSAHPHQGLRQDVVLYRILIVPIWVLAQNDWTLKNIPKLLFTYQYSILILNMGMFVPKN